MKKNRRDIVVRIDRKTAIVALALVLMSVGAIKLYSASLAMTASYPSPVGIYNQIVTTGNAGATPADTTLNRNAGNAILVPPTNGAGRVGIGTASPAVTAKLHVAGKILIADGTQGAGRVLTSDASGLAAWTNSPKGFGGWYCQASGPYKSGSVNPLTAGYSCPAGYKAGLMFGTGGVADCSGSCGAINCYICY